MSPEAPVIPDAPVSDEQTESPVAAAPEAIPPAPAGPDSATPEVTAPALITVPEDIQDSLDATRKAQELTAQATADAAKRVVGPAPGVLPSPVEATQAPVGNNLGGRFGMGVVDAPMPPDPSKVPGWDGEVRR